MDRNTHPDQVRQNAVIGETHTASAKWLPAPKYHLPMARGTLGRQGQTIAGLAFGTTGPALGPENSERLDKR